MSRREGLEKPDNCKSSLFCLLALVEENMACNMSKVLLVLAWLATLVVMKANGLNLQSSVVLDNGGYTNVVVAIDESLQENMDLLTAIQDMFRGASEFLYQATRNRVYFKNVTILIPSHWTNKPEYGSPGRLTFDTADVIIAQPNPLWAPEPYTLQVRGCGEPGSFIHFTEDFLTSDNVIDNYGELGRILVHEWGHYRWGLFNEYPDEIGDPDHVINFYQSGGIWQPVTCSQEYQTFPTRVVEVNGTMLYGKCAGNETTGYEDGCIVTIQNADQATGSIMHGPLTFTQIMNFCDKDSSDLGNLHNREAPNKHNRLCNSRSAWEVMRTHDDFKGNNSLPSNLNAAQIQPTFNLVQAGSGDECRVVLVLDTSGSMRSYNRIGKVNSAATAFLKIVDNGVWIGVVAFTSFPTTHHPLTQITDANRDSLNFTFAAGGGTCIGCGLERGLEVLMQHPSGIVGGGIILLMTDGRDGGIENHPVRQTLQKMNVRVSTVAIGEDAYGQLNEIAQETGGRAIFYPDDGSSDIVSAMTQTVEMCTGLDSSQMRIQLVGEGFSLGIGDTKEGILYFDPFVGNGTQFFVTYTMSNSSSATGVNVMITQPDNTTIMRGNSQYKDDTTGNVITISIDGLAMSGRWLYSIENAFSGAQSVTLSVFSRALARGGEEGEEDDEPIVVTSAVGNSIMDLSSSREPLVAYAQIRKGFRPVVKANVYAIIERPGGYPAENIQLLDDGAGADITANDGIYSRYFTNITGTGFYGIRVVSENDGSAMILTRAQSGMSRVRASIRVTDDGQILSAGNIGPYQIRLPGIESSQTLQGEPAPSFTRSSSAGSTTIANVPEGFTVGQDLFPPNRVQDLRVLRTHVDNLTLVLSWTAPGDDLDAGSASSYDIRIGNSSTQLLDDFTNAARVNASTILEGNLTSPKPFGSSETFVIVIADIPEVDSFSYSFALTATDDGNQTSPVSNVAIATFRRVVPTPPPPGPCVGVTCMNDGELLESTCTCSCTDDFQGTLCQHNKTQLRNGVQIHFQANLTQCEQLVSPLPSAAAEVLNVYCQSNLGVCCPSGVTVANPQGLYLTEDNVMIADGYPIPEQSGGCYVVVYAIQPEEPELCDASESNKRRKRSFEEIHRSRRQLSEQTAYVPQSVLLAGLLSGQERLERALGTAIFGFTRPEVDGDPVMTPTTVPAYLIGVILAIVIFFVFVILCLFWCFARASANREYLKEQHFTRGRGINYGPRFMGEGPVPPRNIQSISGQRHLQITRNHRTLEPGHRSRSWVDDDVYAVAANPVSVYHRPDMRKDIYY